MAFLHPFQTDEFDPGDPAWIQWVCSGQRLELLGWNLFDRGGVLFILIHDPEPFEYRSRLAYPLPRLNANNPIEDAAAFERSWRLERFSGQYPIPPRRTMEAPQQRKTQPKHLKPDRQSERLF